MKICYGSKESWITFNRVTHNPLFRDSRHLYKSNAWRISSNLCSFFGSAFSYFSCKKCLTFFYSMYYNNKKVAIPLHFASHWSACQNFIRIQFEYMRYYTTFLPLLYNSHIHHSFCYPFLGSTQAAYIVSVFYLSTFLHLLKPQH